MATAGDIWALGITIVESLTQFPPATTDERSDIVSLPPTIPPTFVYIVRQCLNRNPANRPTVADLEAQIKRAPVAPAAPIPQLAMRPAQTTAPEQRPPERSLLARVVAVLFVISAAVWGGLQLFQHHPPSQQATVPAPNAPHEAAQQELSRPVAREDSRQAQPPASPAPLPVSPAPSSASRASSAANPGPLPTRPAPLARASSANAAPSVLHQEIPDPSPGARETIHGHIKVAVRVTVDRSGNVVEEMLEDPGPSRYFARLATAAARKWKFTPGVDAGLREWLLRFEFGREGTTAHAVTLRS